MCFLWEFGPLFLSLHVPTCSSLLELFCYVCCSTCFPKGQVNARTMSPNKPLFSINYLGLGILL